MALSTLSTPHDQDEGRPEPRDIPIGETEADHR